MSLRSASLFLTTGNVQTVTISTIIGLITLVVLYILHFYSKLLKYPKGPIPLPLVGNIFLFKGRMIHEVLVELREKYGDVYTIWFGTDPSIVFATHDAINEAYVTKKNDFAGRPTFSIREESIVNKGGSEVVLEDWGRPWEVLRRVAHTATRKFSASPKLPKIIVNIVDEVVDLIIKEKELNEPFNINDYTHLMVYSLIASIAAGKSYSVKDPEFLELKRANDIAIAIQSDLTVIIVVPILKYIGKYRTQWNKFLDVVKVNHKWCKDQMRSHISNRSNLNKTNQEREVSDFCDALLDAKIESEESDSKAAAHLTTDNLENLVQNLFEAGTETTRITLDWIFLTMANFPDVQTKLRIEVSNVIGEDIPTNEHRLKCNYVQAFLAEVLRFAPQAPSGLPHKAIVDSEVKGHKIPKGTTVMALHEVQLRGEDLWGDPKVFRPERFVDQATGIFQQRSASSGYVPFGIGRRSCLGEKLAILDLFIILVRFLQKTQGYILLLKNGPESGILTPDLNQPASYSTVDHEFVMVEEKLI